MDGMYGWRGTTLITGAIVLNISMLGLLMKSPSKKHKKRDKSSGIFNIKVFRNISFFLFLLNNVIFFFGHSIVSIHLPAYAMHHGVSQDMAAYLVSIGGVASLVGRIVGNTIRCTFCHM